MLSNHIAFLQIILVFRGSVFLSLGEACASGVISAELGCAVSRGLFETQATQPTREKQQHLLSCPASYVMGLNLQYMKRS